MRGGSLVGQLARRQAILNPKGTIYSAKRFIGRRYDEVTSELNAVSFDVVAGPGGAVRFKIMVPSRVSRKERRLFEELAAASSFDPRKQR
jgi:molecular chaperone DnaK (HSP70)